MKLPLNIVASPYKPLVHIQIADATGVIVCTLPKSEIALAIAIVRKFNQPTWWHKLIGPPRDARQRAYDAWVARRA